MRVGVKILKIDNPIPGDKPKSTNWKKVHEVADSRLNDVAKAFIDGVDSFKSSIYINDIQSLLESGDADAALSAFDIAVLSVALEPMVDILREIYRDSALSIKDTFPSDIKIKASFDLFNPRSVNYIRNYGGNLITGITEKTRESIREIIANAIESGGHPRTQAIKIRSLIGINERQAKALDNYRELLISEGFKGSKLESKVKSYYNRQLKYRAENIARTETINAANAGQRELWRQMADQGIINRREMRRFWILTPDDRLCPICSAIPRMNPDGIPLDGMYQSTIGPLEGPTAHPSCRCAEEIRLHK